MLIWIVFALLIAVPFIVHLRGGGIVEMAVSAAILYPVGILVAVLKFDGAPPSETAEQTLEGGTVSDTYLYAANYTAFGWLIALFIVIALVFWLLARWGADLPQERLKNLFWLLHISLLALPFAMFVFITFGIFETYLGGDANLPIFAMSSMIVSILCLIAVAGFIFTALTVAIKRLRA